jgi:flagellin
MSSILTNNGAMVALQTMRQINRGMESVQNQISTGLKIGSAKDNAATWAISKVMESDVAGFKAIKENLSLGSSTVNVARSATETTTKLLTEIKEKIVQAQEDNVDRDKIQNDIVQLRGQIDSVIQSAQFNGLNLVNGSNTGDVQVLSSLNRTADDVSAASIAVATQNLTFNGFAAGSVSGLVTNLAGTPTAAIEGADVAIPGAGAGDPPSYYSTSVNGRSFTVELTRATYDALGGGTPTQELANQFVANELQSQIDAVFGAGTLTLSGDADSIDIVAAATAPEDAPFRVEIGNGNVGALQSLSTLDVGASATDADRAAALDDIENMIQAAIDASSAFGSSQKRIEIQQDFVGNLMDSLRSGIGSLVDADMEEASARLQALQVQQQLGTQALTIANQQPQNILALFR